jgi:hypothetical protein
MAKKSTPVVSEVTTTQSSESTEQVPTPGTPQPQDFSVLDTLTPEQLALAAIKAKQTCPTLVKAVGRLARKATRLQKRANKKAAKLDPNSPTYNAEYAERVRVREANKAAGPKTPGQPRSSSDKLETVKALLTKAESKLSPERVRKAGVKPMHNDTGSVTGFRATVRISQPEGDEAVFRKTLTLAKTPDISLDQMRVEAETYVLHVLKTAA